MTQQLPVADIRPNPRNPRERFENIEELANSIEEQGLEVPVKVRPQGDEYELVHGERRLRAVKSLGQETIRAEVEEMSDQRALEVSITENLQREDVTELAEARSYKNLCDEFGMTQAEVAEKVGKSQSHVANRLRLLDMPDVLQRDILHKILSPWQARIIASNWDDYLLRDFTIKFDLSVSELRDIVDQLDEGKDRVRISQDYDIDSLEQYVVDDWEAWYQENDVPESERPQFSIGPFENFRLWANENIDGFQMDVPYDTDIDGDLRDGPIVREYQRPQLVYPNGPLSLSGSKLVREALRYGYDGDITVNLVVNRTYLERFNQTIECPDCHGEALFYGTEIDCPECGGPHELNPQEGGSA